MKNLLKEIALYLLVAMVLFNVTVNVIQDSYDSAIIQNLETITSKLIKVAGIVNSNIDEISDNRQDRQNLSNIVNRIKNSTKQNSTLLNAQRKLMAQYQINLAILNQITKPYIRPDFDRLLNGTVVIYENLKQTAGVCVREDENYYYILSVAHGVDGTRQTKREIAIPESNLGHVIKLDTIKSFLENDNYLVPLQEVTNITVVLKNGLMRAGQLLKICDKIDLALVKVSKLEDNEIEVLSIAQDYPLIGDRVYVIGHPLGITYNLTEGIVSNFSRNIYMVIDSMMTFGNSGGGVFNNNGEIVGISSAVPVYVIIKD